MKNASYAPVYAAMYPEIAEIVRLHGYALAIHGSLQRDFDVIAIPFCDILLKIKYIPRPPYVARLGEE